MTRYLHSNQPIYLINIIYLSRIPIQKAISLYYCTFLGNFDVNELFIS